MMLGRCVKMESGQISVYGFKGNKQDFLMNWIRNK